ncbi:S-adenosyl-L-methionine-dependent methyltransferase [Tuber borchii]|uniref:S-adenosyl-L-methionine-dependent methyltransferase n=1 Tax=Tuber borchii TaxID=42251 RepID=A0A2T7A0T0_TUBBO|nr:S-adenosyl-L-methionine-dependent methyltransferase [Tuber borchii]
MVAEDVTGEVVGDTSARHYNGGDGDSKQSEYELSTLDGSIFDSDGSSIASSMSSAVRSNSSILSNVGNYKFEHDRRYHSYREGNWVLPNDQQEQDRMDIFHQMALLRMDDKLHLSPLENPRRILDIGTGTGIWAIEMAFKYPGARVIGTDLSPIQVSPPANCSFEVEDADSEWVYPTNNFDMIHTRQLLGGISDWRMFFEQAYAHARPGGWLELQETPPEPHNDGPTPPADLPFLRVFSLFTEASASTSRPFADQVSQFTSHMKAVGFVDVTSETRRLPLGTWPIDPVEKEIGRYNVLNFLEGMESYTLALFTRVLGMSAEQVRSLIDEAKKDVCNRKLRWYFDLVIVRGRKPYMDEVVST